MEENLAAVFLSVAPAVCGETLRTRSRQVGWGETGGGMDIIYVAISVAFFAVTGALIHFLSKL